MSVRKCWMAVVAAAVTAGVSAASPIAFVVSVDTSAIPLKTGLIEIQLNPGPTDPQQAANASLTGYGGDATLGAALPAIGDVFGALDDPNGLFIDNGVVSIESDPLNAGTVISALNDYAQYITYANRLEFRLGFGGDALSLPDGSPTGSPSTFYLSLWSFDPDGNPVSLGDINGIVLSIDLTHQGTAEVTSQADFISLFLVPEPSSFLLAAGALAVLLYRARRPAKIRVRP